MYATIVDMTRIQRLSTFGGRLRTAREDAGLNQMELTNVLAERYGVVIGRSYISELERNWEANKMPSAEVVAALARALNVNGNWLLLIDDRQEVPGEPAIGGFTQEAEQASVIIDRLPEAERKRVLAVITALASHVKDASPPDDLHAERERWAGLVERKPGGING